MKNKKNKQKYAIRFTIFTTILSMILSIGVTVLLDSVGSVTQPWIYISVLSITFVNAFAVVIIVYWYGDSMEGVIEDVGALSNSIWEYLGTRKLEHKDARKELTQWINDAEESIIACTYYIPSGKFDKQNYDNSISNERREFANAINRKIKKSIEDGEGGFKFKRIYQFNNRETDIEEFKDEINNNSGSFSDRVDEFKLFYSMENKKYENFRIYSSEVRINATFYLVDNKKMMMYVDTKSDNLFDKPLAFALTIENNKTPEFVQKLFEDGRPFSQLKPIVNIA